MRGSSYRGYLEVIVASSMPMTRVARSPFQSTATTSGTLRAIINQAGLTVSEFVGLLR
jgi:hypothetical protein